MSQRIATVSALFTAALLAGLAASASPAEAQCRRAWACSSLQISVGVSGGVYIGPMAPPPPPQVVYVQPVPQPPVVVYQPQPQVVELGHPDLTTDATLAGVAEIGKGASGSAGYRENNGEKGGFRS